MVWQGSVGDHRPYADPVKEIAKSSHAAGVRGKLAVMTGGIARYARSTPGYIPCTAPRCPPREYVIVITKRRTKVAWMTG